jgi:Ni/Fe-hydrogenase subunit HybB-like protein
MTSITAREAPLARGLPPFRPRGWAGLVVREVRAMPVALRAWLALLLVVLAAAAVAAVIALPPGWDVLGTSPSVEWGLLIVAYVFFAITTSGLCLASSLGTVFGIERFRPLEKRHAILALLCLCTAFGIIALDLHYPVRLVFGAVLSPSPSSPMWWMGVCYGAYLAILCVEVWSLFWPHERIHQAACTAAMCMAIAAPMTLGLVFGVLANRPLWYGPFTPALMVSSAFLAGTSLLGIVFALVARLRLSGAGRARSLAIPSIRLLLTIGLVVVSALVVRAVVAGVLGEARGEAAAIRAVVAGPLAWQFWAGRVLLGLVVPLALVLLPATRTARGLGLAAVLSLIGVFVDRLVLVDGGQIAPYTAVSGVVSGPYASYAPTAVEVLIVAGAVALVAFLYTLAERYLDLSESDIHRGFFIPMLAGRLRDRLRRLTAQRTLGDATPGGAE